MKRTILLCAVLIMIFSTFAVKAEINPKNRFPLYQSAIIKNLGGDIRGFGMLAYYSVNPPESVYIKRKTQIPSEEPMTTEMILRAFRPDGSLCAYYRMPETVEHEYILNLGSDNEAGIWRFSVCGGREGDVVDIGLPETEIWGIRGEMALGLTETIPENIYIYMAETTNYSDRSKWHRTVLPSGYLYAEALPVNHRGTVEISLYDENDCFINEASVKDSGRKTLLYDPVTTGEVMRIKLENSSGAVVFDGVPGLLCPTRAAAEFLKGGTVEQDGFILAGPMQARIREQMIKIYRSGGLSNTLKWPTSIPDYADPMREILFYCKYSPISDIDMRFDNQVTDIYNPYFGQVIYEASNELEKLYSSSGFANSAVQYGDMNPAYMDEAVIKRALLSGLAEMVYTQGDDILRDNKFQQVAYPSSDVFFAYGAQIVAPYILLNEYMDEELKSVWREMMMAIGDKASYSKCYQSNQWILMLDGHLNMYLATGEQRFLDYFNNQISIYLDNGYGASSKFGQHPAGYFLEEYGPDGNYQSMNLYGLLNCYYKYSKISDNNEIYLKMKNAIQKALEFDSFHWILQPDGRIKSPTHMNGRTASMFGNPNFPGDYMAKPKFGLGLRRWLMNSKDTDYSAGRLGGYIINDEEWAIGIINDIFPLKGAAYEKIGDMYPFDGLFEAYGLEHTAQPEKIPTDYMNMLWELPGQTAWKKGSLYGLVFYDVSGSTANIPKSIIGGGPSVFWSEGTGNTVCSMGNLNENNAVLSEDDLTFSCVYEEVNGEFIYTGKKHPRYEKISENEFEINEPFKEGNITWRYHIEDEYTELSAVITGTSHEAVFMNLPMQNDFKNTRMYFENDDTFVFSYEGAFMQFEGVLGGTLSETVQSGSGKTKRLSIPFNSNRISLKITAAETVYKKNGEYIFSYNFDKMTTSDLQNSGITFAGLPKIENGILKLSYNPSFPVENKNTAGRSFVTLNEKLKGTFIFESTYIFYNNIEIPKRYMLSFGLTENGTSIFENPVSYGTSTSTSSALYIGGSYVRNLVDGQRYTIKLIVDFDASIYFAYLNGEFIGDFPFLTQLKECNVIRIIDSFGSSDGSHINYIDDFYVYNVIPIKIKNGSTNVYPTEFYSSKTKKSLYVIEDTEIEVRNIVSNMSARPSCAVMYTGLFMDNKLIKVTSTDKEIILPYSKKELVSYVEIPDNCSGYILKRFIWDGKGELVPLTYSDTLEEAKY